MRTSGRALTLPNADGGEWKVTQWPDSSFVASFRGSTVFLQIGPNHEILHIVADGRTPLALRDPQPGVYRLDHLGPGTHTVRVEVITESQKIPNYFGGFRLAAAKDALPPAVTTRQIEFIGDSHTVGYGNTSAKPTCTQEEVWATTDTSAAFGPLVARHFGAEVQVNAISGRGIVRNYDGSAGPTLPEAYPFVLFDQQQHFADPSWRPQLIVIALGTNDFSTELHAGERWKTRDELRADYERTYLSFLQQLRSAHPDTYFLLWATNMAHGEIETEVQHVLERARSAGEQRIAFLPMNDLRFTGCHAHPSLADDHLLRDHMIEFIDAHQQEIWPGANSLR